MKTDLRCSKCDSRQLWVVQKVGHIESSLVRTMPVTAANFNFFDGSVSETTHTKVGYFEAWICSQCGFTEWYARDVNERLAALSRVPGTGVQFYNGPADSGPYR